MSTYQRIASRLALLLLLVTVAIMAKPTNATAFTLTCETQCYVQYQSCLSQCNSWLHKPVGGCFDFCGVPYQDCLSTC